MDFNVQNIQVNMTMRLDLIIKITANKYTFLLDLKVPFDNK